MSSQFTDMELDTWLAEQKLLADPDIIREPRPATRPTVTAATSAAVDAYRRFLLARAESEAIGRESEAINARLGRVEHERLSEVVLDMENAAARIDVYATRDGWPEDVRKRRLTQAIDEAAGPWVEGRLRVQP